MPPKPKKSAPVKRPAGSPPGEQASSPKNERPDVEVLPSPTKPRIDKNEYQLIKLPNGINALLIHESDESQKAPYWHHRSPSRLGVSDYTPCVDELTAPEFNGVGLPYSATRFKGQRSQRNALGLGAVGSGLFPSTDAPSENILLACSPEGIPHDQSRHSNAALQSNEAAFALTVNVGSSNDPKDFNGLAHFCEHMVHYGSRKYRTEDAYFRFVMNKGEGANAFTQCMTTTYHYSVDKDHLEKAVDIFANMISNPLFNVDCIEREVEAVDNEFILKEHLDMMAVLQILYATAPRNHPLNSFPCGNKQTLLHKDDRTGTGLSKLKAELRRFHKEHYVGSGITLAVQSSDTLPDLQKLVLKHFAQIPQGNKCLRREMEIPENLSSPFDTELFKKLYIVSGKQSHRHLSISWALPPNLWRDYKSKPMEFLGSIIEDEWENGLANQLRREGLISDMAASCPPVEVYRNEYTSVFMIRFVLNANPNSVRSLEKDIEIILEKVFSYLHRIRELTIHQKTSLWTEMATDTNLNFEYSGAGDRSDLTVQGARFLQTIPGEDIFVADSCVDCNYDDDAVIDTLRLLTPDKMNVTFMMPESKLEPLSRDMTKAKYTSHVEEYTKTKFWRKAISPSVLQKLTKAKDWPSLEISRNPFTATRKNVLVSTPINPHTVVETATYKVNHHGHSGSFVHKAVCDIYIASSQVKTKRANFCKLKMLEGCLQQILLPKTSAMSRAGIDVAIYQTKDSLRVMLQGFSENFRKAVEDIFQALWGGSRTPEERFSEDLFELVKGLQYDNHYDAMGNGQYLMRELFQEYTNLESHSFRSDLTIIEKMTYVDFANFVELFRLSSYALIQVYGNASISCCREIGHAMSTLEYGLRNENWKSALIFTKPVTCSLPGDGRCIRVKSANRKENNSYLCNCYQASVNRFVDSESIVEFIGLFMRSPNFQILRTQKQLGYHVSVEPHIGYLKTPMIIITVAYPACKQSACKVDKEIDRFLRQFYDDHLSKLTDAEFNEQRLFWGFPPTLTKQYVVTWYRDTFMDHLDVQGDGLFRTWDRNAGKISKLTIQVLGCTEEDCKNQLCKDGEWVMLDADKDKCISFTKNKLKSERRYFIHDFPAVPGRNAFR